MNPFQSLIEAWAGNSDPNRCSRLPGGRCRAAFTLIELLVVISIIALLASLVVGLAKHAGTNQKRSRVQAERDQIVTAIEAYKAHFGQYPPDNFSPSTGIVNPVTNQLFYELTGVLVEDVPPRFHARDREQQIPSAYVNLVFNREGFVNAGTTPKEVKSFIDLKSSQRRTLRNPPNPDIEVLAVSVDWPANNPLFPPPFNAYPDAQTRQVNPWRYVKTNPTNNPDGFDLWAEYVEGGKIRIICNWSKDVLDR